MPVINFLHELRKTLSKCYRRLYKLISKFKVGFKNLIQHLQQGLSEAEFYVDLVSEPEFYVDLGYKLKINVGLTFLISSEKSVMRNKRIEHNENVKNCMNPEK